MKTTRLGVVAVLLPFMLCAEVAVAQSLGDVARQQREAKKSGASKVVTNDDIPPTAAPGNPAAVEPILKALKSDDLKTRTEIMLAIWKTSQQKDIKWDKIGPIIPGLAEALLDRNLNIRYMAASALKNFAPVAKPAVPALIQALDTFPGGTPELEGPQRYYADARWVAVEALGAIGPAAKESIPALTKALADPSPDVRKAAAAALKQIQEK